MSFPSNRYIGPTGFVSLIGAGPGDPELLTLKAVRRLTEADLVLFDGLVSQDVVAMAKRAQRFSVSKRVKRPSVNQETIHRLMIRGAQRGKRVVRLKCGDPFVLGRGGEEALALQAAGVAFEVIPGITAAISAESLAGIPVTHRGIASGFMVVSGHDRNVFEPLLASVAPGSMTVIILMGLLQRSEISATLLRTGWSADTPCAIIQSASMPQMQLWKGHLRELGSPRLTLPGKDLPGTIVIGEVTRLSGLIHHKAETRETIDAIALRG